MVQDVFLCECRDIYLLRMGRDTIIKGILWAFIEVS